MPDKAQKRTLLTQEELFQTIELQVRSKEEEKFRENILAHPPFGNVKSIWFWDNTSGVAHRKSPGGRSMVKA